MNKRFVLLPLSLIAIFLTGCGKEDTSISSGNTTEPSSSENPSTDDDSSYGEEVPENAIAVYKRCNFEWNILNTRNLFLWRSDNDWRDKQDDVSC